MIYAFEDFTLDTRRCSLRRAGEPRHLEPQVYTVLCHLLANRDRLVTKEELLDHVRGHRFVTPATLNSRIKALRQALVPGARFVPLESRNHILLEGEPALLRFLEEVRAILAPENERGAPRAEGRLPSPPSGR